MNCCPAQPAGKNAESEAYHAASAAAMEALYYVLRDPANRGYFTKHPQVFCGLLHASQCIGAGLPAQLTASACLAGILEDLPEGDATMLCSTDIFMSATAGLMVSISL